MKCKKSAHTHTLAYKEANLPLPILAFSPFSPAIINSWKFIYAQKGCSNWQAGGSIMQHATMWGKWRRQPQGSRKQRQCDGGGRMGGGGKWQLSWLSQLEMHWELDKRRQLVDYKERQPNRSAIYVNWSVCVCVSVRNCIYVRASNDSCACACVCSPSTKYATN